MTVHTQWFEQATRRAFTHVDRNGERTITTIGPKLLPHGPLPLEGTDTIFFVAGDAEALRSARAARFLAATTREVPTLEQAAVHLDLLVGSGNDPGEAYDGGLDVGVLVITDGPRGGTANGRHFDAAPLPGPIADTYGAGDTFGCTLSFALGRGDDLDDALAFAARESAEVLTLAARTARSDPDVETGRGRERLVAAARPAALRRLGRREPPVAVAVLAQPEHEPLRPHRVVREAVERDRDRGRPRSLPRRLRDDRRRSGVGAVEPQELRRHDHRRHALARTRRGGR